MNARKRCKMSKDSLQVNAQVSGENIKMDSTVIEGNTANIRSEDSTGLTGNAVIANSNGGGAAADFFDEIAAAYQTVDTSSTERVLEEIDLLITEYRQDMENRNATNDSTGSHQNNGTNVSEPQPMEVDEVVNDTAQMRVGNNTVNEISGRSNTNNRVHAASPVDDCVVICDDNIRPDVVAPSIDVGDEVIFVNETRSTQQRITAFVDLCSPEIDYEVARAARNRTTTVEPTTPPPSSASTSVPTPTSPPGFAIKCPICLDSVEGHKVYSTTCGHLYCGPCIQSSVKTRKKCPVCNKKLAPKDVHRIYFSS